MVSRLHLSEKQTQGIKQGAKSPGGFTQGREFGVFPAFLRFSLRVRRMEQDLGGKLILSSKVSLNVRVLLFIR